MNWLAHVLLSEPTPGFRIGNLLPDLMGATELASLPIVFQRGIACHRCIDRFTDKHPLVRRSVGRVSPKHRRFAPILVDVFYDHFLSVTWKQYCTEPLDEFLAEIYASFDTQWDNLSPMVLGHLYRMREENWLGSYQDITGIRLTLERISRRFRRPVKLGEAVAELEQNYNALNADFAEFFPELRAQVASHLISPDSSASMPACL